ncbi:hypothetical protein ABZP36_022615 [Zizania latifolia]
MAAGVDDDAAVARLLRSRRAPGREVPPPRRQARHHAANLASRALAAHADIDGKIEEAERKEEEWDRFYEAKRKEMGEFQAMAKWFKADDRKEVQRLRDLVSQVRPQIFALTDDYLTVLPTRLFSLVHCACFLQCQTGQFLATRYKLHFFGYWSRFPYAIYLARSFAVYISRLQGGGWGGGERRVVGCAHCFYDNFSDTLEEDGACSSGDSSLLRRAMDHYGGVFDDEVTSQLSRRGGGQSKENLRAEIRTASTFVGKCPGGQEPMDLSLHKFQALGTPSAPPIAGDGNDAIFNTVGE